MSSRLAPDEKICPVESRSVGSAAGFVVRLCGEVFLAAFGISVTIRVSGWVVSFSSQMADLLPSISPWAVSDAGSMTVPGGALPGCDKVNAQCKKQTMRRLKKRTGEKKCIQKIKADATASKAKGGTEGRGEGCSAEKSSCMCLTVSSGCRNRFFSVAFWGTKCSACSGFSHEPSHLEIQPELRGTVRHCEVKMKRSDYVNPQAACSSPCAVVGWYK